MFKGWVKRSSTSTFACVFYWLCHEQAGRFNLEEEQAEEADRADDNDGA